MAAAKLDIVLEEHSDLTKEFVYRDADGNPIDVSNWGGAIVLAEEREENEVKGHIYTGFSSDSDTPIMIGGTDGLIELQVPHVHYQNLNIIQGVWEVYIYPTIGDLDDRPKRLIQGTFHYSPSLLKS